MSGLITRVVRALGSDVVHVVDIPPALLDEYLLLGSLFTGVATPVNTRCGATLKGRGAVVCMKPGTSVRCSRCRRLTGITSAGIDNTKSWRAER